MSLSDKKSMWGMVAPLAITSLLLITTLTLAQEEPALFSVSPGEFTVWDAPAMGRPYLLERKLVVRNGDNIARLFILSVRPPSSENIKEGYEPIPDENWIVLIPMVIKIRENSWGSVDMYLNIPRDENLTNRKWEAWISVERQEAPGEVAKLEIISIARIETASELPPLEWLPLPPAMIALIVGIAAVAIALAVWIRRRRGREEVRGRVFRRSS